MAVDATEIQIRAERRLGEMLTEQSGNGGMAKGTRGQLNGRDSSGAPVSVGPEDSPTLRDVGISYNLSSRAQKVAAVPEDEFESRVDEWRSRVVQKADLFGSRKNQLAHFSKTLKLRRRRLPLGAAFWPNVAQPPALERKSD